SGCPPGTATQVVFAAVDNCANRSLAASTLTVRDTTAPAVQDCKLRPAAPPLPPTSLAPEPAPVLPPAPAPPRGAKPAGSPCSGATSAWVRVYCGSSSDACDAAPRVDARIVVTNHD